MPLPVLRRYINRQRLVRLQNLLGFVYKTLENLFLYLTMSEPSLDPESQFTDEPPPFDPTEPSIPISYPLKTLQELESRSYFQSFHYPFNKSNVGLRSEPLPNRPRMLVCHDMAGGYVDDKWIQGGTNPEAYSIWHWCLIDVFVYFSHSLVTLPPPCWINTAHRHGVKVLGTFITEWDEGRAICDALLSTQESAQMYAGRLAELAVALGFDGWLLNIEVNLDSKQIPILKVFISHLAESMHSLMPRSLVIWYDSVTVDGKLNWQDQLNELNKPFFDICDGIFVNYTWKEDYPRKSAEVSGDRKFDVYMGIDVFGRNTFGGGQWNTNVALDLLRKEDVSAAIFAPGWVYETDQPPNFQTAQNRWWTLVQRSWGISRSYPQVLPFYSNFDQGQGNHFTIDGEKISNTPWFNISSQALQPLIEFTDSSSSDSVKSQIEYNEDIYSGGGCITFKGTVADNSFVKIKLFHGELVLDDYPLHVMYTVKLEEDVLLGLSLEFSSTYERKSILLAPIKTSAFSSDFNEFVQTRRRENRKSSRGWVVEEGSIQMIGCKLTDIYAVCYRSDIEITSKYYAVLGNMRMKYLVEKSVFPLHTSWLVDAQYINWTLGDEGSKRLNLKLTWNLKNGNGFAFPNYYVYVQKLAKMVDGNMNPKAEEVKEYVGVAHVEAFYISGLEIPRGTSNLKFIIQVCGVDGSTQKLDESPFLMLDTEGRQ